MKIKWNYFKKSIQKKVKKKEAREQNSDGTNRKQVGRLKSNHIND